MIESLKMIGGAVGGGGGASAAAAKSSSLPPPIAAAAAACITMRAYSGGGASTPPSQQQQQRLLLLHRLTKEMEKQPPEDTRTFAPSVRALYESLSGVRNAGEVESLLNDVAEFRFPLPVFCSVIRKLGSCGRSDAAMAVFEWLDRNPSPQLRPDIFIYCSALGVLRRTSRFDLLPHLLRRMSDNGVSPDLVAYKIIISCYETMNLHSLAIASYLQLRSNAFLLRDTHTLRTLLHGCSSAADIDGALIIYSDYDAAGDSCDWLRSAVSGVAYRSVRRMLSDRLSHSLILALVERVENAIGRLSPSDYQGIIWSCGGGGHEEDRIVAQRMVERRTAMGYRISAAACNHAMNLLQRAGDSAAAAAIFEQMLAEGPAPDRDSHRLMRQIVSTIQWRQKGNQLWEAEVGGGEAGNEAVEAAMAACAGRGDADGAAELFGRMVEEGRMPSVAAYGALLRALQRSERREEALKVWRHMKKVGVRPNAEAYDAMEAVYAAAAAS